MQGSTRNQGCSTHLFAPRPISSSCDVHEQRVVHIPRSPPATIRVQPRWPARRTATASSSPYTQPTTTHQDKSKHTDERARFFILESAQTDVQAATIRGDINKDGHATL